MLPVYSSQKGFTMVEIELLVFTGRFNQLLLALTAACLMAPGAARADFGAADTGSGATTGVDRFNAWCGKSGNDCTIEFLSLIHI